MIGYPESIWMKISKTLLNKFAQGCWKVRVKVRLMALWTRIFLYFYFQWMYCKILQYFFCILDFHNRSNLRTFVYEELCFWSKFVYYGSCYKSKINVTKHQKPQEEIVKNLLQIQGKQKVKITLIIHIAMLNFANPAAPIIKVIFF